MTVATGTQDYTATVSSLGTPHGMIANCQSPPEKGPTTTAVADLDAMYGRRFSRRQDRVRRRMWAEIARFLQRHVPDGAHVLDIAADNGHLLAGIRADVKIASDIRDTSAELPDDVRFIRSDSLALRDALPVGELDVVFMSNFLEHLPSGAAVIEQFRVVFDLLRPGGRVIVLQPNVRLTKGAYWDFVDHATALTERSLEEAATLAGFRRRELITRFLPYTTKSRLPKHRLVVRLYLALRPAWWIFGKQTLYIGEKP